MIKSQFTYTRDFTGIVSYNGNIKVLSLYLHYGKEQRVNEFQLSTQRLAFAEHCEGGHGFCLGAGKHLVRKVLVNEAESPARTVRFVSALIG
jgi:hypothetical protein